MSELADADQRARDAARLREEARLEDLRARLSTWSGRTVEIDVSDAHYQHAHIHARIVSVSKDEIELVDLSDATVPPPMKPILRIGLGRIRAVRFG